MTQIGHKVWSRVFGDEVISSRESSLKVKTSMTDRQLV